jgi:diguanylate cyclase (GGDEF)-like protein/PAS domain S-box-containing protein
MNELKIELNRCAQAPRLYESRFNSIVNHSVDGVLIVNGEGVILFTNPAAASMFGRRQEELQGVLFGFPIIGADRTELDIPTLNGRILVVEMRVAETDWDGQQAFLTQLRDITQRKQMEDSLRLAARVFENSAEGILILDSQMKLVSGNRAFTQMTGFSDEDIVSKKLTDLWSDLQPSGTFSELLREALAHRGRWQGEVQCHGKNGQMFPGWLSAVVVRDQSGFITHYVIIVSDISERKANENALRLAAVVFEQSIEAVMILDASERFLSINRSFTTITGYILDEVIGQSPRLLKSGHHDAIFYRNLRQQLREQGFWQGEIWNRRKSGEVYPEWLSISTARDGQGNIINYIGIFYDITERKAQEAQMSRLAFFDPLTRLPNRTLLMDRLQQGLAKAHRTNRRMGVIFLDLNHFKKINDEHGHNVGDIVLIQVAQRFQATLRQGETLARFGGDEFVTLVEANDPGDVAIVVERLQQTLLKPIVAEHYHFTIRVSAGIAIYPDHGRDGDELIKQADIAMYRAKNSGVDYCFFHLEMLPSSPPNDRLVSRLQKALRTDTLQLFFQPQFNLRTGQLVGAEALLRWYDEQDGWISPSEFIPLAEASGLMSELGAWVLRTACRQLLDWRTLGLSLPEHLTINVSRLEFEAPDYPNQVLNIFNKFVTDATQFELELSESSLFQNVNSSLSIIRALHEQQFSLAIDDFGSGYSSLAQLAHFPVQKLKIAASFVKNILHNKQDYTIVQTIIAMAHSLGLRVIAKGIEDKAQIECLLAMQCEEGQGFFYAPPVPGPEFARRWLKR